MIPDHFEGTEDLSTAKDKGTPAAPAVGGGASTLAQEFSPTENKGGSTKDIQISEAASPGAGTGSSAAKKPAGVDSFASGTV